MTVSCRYLQPRKAFFNLKQEDSSYAIIWARTMKYVGTERKHRYASFLEVKTCSHRNVVCLLLWQLLSYCAVTTSVNYPFVFTYNRNHRIRRSDFAIFLLPLCVCVCVCARFYLRSWKLHVKMYGSDWSSIFCMATKDGSRSLRKRALNRCVANTAEKRMMKCGYMKNVAQQTLLWRHFYCFSLFRSDDTITLWWKEWMILLPCSWSIRTWTSTWRKATVDWPKLLEKEASSLPTELLLLITTQSLLLHAQEDRLVWICALQNYASTNKPSLIRSKRKEWIDCSSFVFIFVKIIILSDHYYQYCCYLLLWVWSFLLLFTTYYSLPCF